MDKTIYSRQSKALCHTLVAMRESAGLTQRQLAAKLKREHNLVGRLELDERRLDVVEFYWFCKACGANPESAARSMMRRLQELDTNHPAE